MDQVRVFRANNESVKYAILCSLSRQFVLHVAPKLASPCVTMSGFGGNVSTCSGVAGGRSAHEGTMNATKISTLALALAFSVVVGVHNSNRNFQPPLRSHVELFLAGVPAGFVVMTLILPEQTEAFYFAVGAGIFAGILYSYTLPRHWRFQKRRKDQRDSSPRS